MNELVVKLRKSFSSSNHFQLLRDTICFLNNYSQALYYRGILKRFLDTEDESVFIQTNIESHFQDLVQMAIGRLIAPGDI